MADTNSRKLYKIHKRPQDDSDDEDECKVCSAIKDETKIKWLLESIEVNDLFRDLNPQQKRQIVLAMKLIEVQQNIVVLKQHSVIPQTVYVVEDGEFFAIIDGVRVRSWVKKGIFGELALLYDSPRAATIECVSDNGHLWELDRTTFKHICEEYADIDETEDELTEIDENLSVLLTSSAIHVKKRSSLRLVQKQIDLKTRSIEQKQKSGNYKEADEVQQLFSTPQISTSDPKTDAMNCIQFKRIAFVLSKYQNNEMGDDKYAYLNTKLGANYSNTQLCDDFYFVVNTYNNDYDFEILYKILMAQYMNDNAEECDVDTCLMYKRNMRDRNEYEANVELYYGGIAIRELIVIHLLDKIHCYFLHAYHENHRLRNDEMNDVSDVSKMSTIIRERRNAAKSRRKHDNKYKMQNVDKEKEEADEKEKDESNVAPVYSFGVEFWYWDEANLKKKENQFIIAQKYKSLKEELVYNDICAMKSHQFDVLNATATELSKMKHVIETYVADWNNRGIKRGQIITEAHLICLMVYCNFDTLQRKFTETYRKIDKYESNDEMVSRHSNFYQLGKYLYEAVNIYGKSIKDYKYKQFYHGISDEMMFASPKARIYGPLSTTISISVATHFSDDDGLVVVLRGDEWEDNKYFDMCWISEFASESECFFIGGLLPMRFHNILNTKKGVNYKKYLPKFNILFTKIFNGVKYQFKSGKAQKEKQIIEKLINNRLSKMSDEAEKNKEYIYRLFDYYCNERNYLSINYPYFQKEFDAFFDVEDMINLDELFNVFPNIKHLKIDYLELSQLFMQHLQDFIAKISKNTSFVLQIIQLNWPTVKGDEIEKVIDPFAKTLNAFKFEIVYQKKENKVFVQYQN